jgi:hypothetical protein
MDDQLIERPPLNIPLIVVAAAVILGGLGAWYYFSHRTPPPPPQPAIAQPVAPAPAPGDTVEHPLPAASVGGPQAPLPALPDSDKVVGDALGDAVGAAAVAQYLVPESVVRHLVVTIDNLSRQKVAVDKRPIVATTGIFMVNGDELHATLDAQNFQRYQPAVEVIRKADMQRVAAVYLRFYPLFQQAYQDLGYPTGYFNDRLVKVIDELLATPQVTGPVDLVRPNVMYLFADPTLESRPAGQKLLIRMGPDNAATIKAKLTELRAIITAAPPKH